MDSKIITVSDSKGLSVDINPIHVSHVIHADGDKTFIYIAGETYIEVPTNEGARFAEQWKSVLSR